VIQKIRRRREPVDRRGQLVDGPRREVGAEIRRLHHARTAAGHHQPPGPGQPPGQGRRHPVRHRTAWLGVAAHDADRAFGAVHSRPGREGLTEGVVDAGIVQTLGERFPDVRRRTAVLDEMVEHHGVVHPGETVLGEPERQVLGRVQRGRMSRVRPGLERWHQVRAAPDQVDLHLGRGELAADEQGPVDVHVAKIGRIQVESQSEHDQVGEGPLGEVDVELGTGLDLERGRIERDVAAQNRLQGVARHDRQDTGGAPPTVRLLIRRQVE
jgi:hypothetical protein